ncbi:MAG: GNAT family N-acetyltransferase [Bdellovibrionales bacterium]|nr:GNAT family N-acetyltransferase [Bdellovibrionales bacterium]
MIRWAQANDVQALAELIRELAVYEKLEKEAVASEDDLRKYLFSDRKYAEALIAEKDGTAVGFALFFHNFSTFLGKPGLYLEDLFVKPKCRGEGIGIALLAHLAGIAKDRGCGRMEWSVLNWNQPAIDFYLKLGAVPMSDWSVYRLKEKEIAALAQKIE